MAYETHLTELTDMIPAYPSQREAAAMLRISASVLSRCKKVEAVSVGERGRHYSPGAVLTAGAIYKKRSLNELAAELLEYAREHGDEEAVARARREIDKFFLTRTVEPVDREVFLQQARRSLPGSLFREVERAFEEGVSADADIVATDPQAGLKPLQS